MGLGSKFSIALMVLYPLMEKDLSFVSGMNAGFYAVLAATRIKYIYNFHFFASLPGIDSSILPHQATHEAEQFCIGFLEVAQGIELAELYVEVL